MAVDQKLKIELGKQGIFVTTIEELYNWGRQEFGVADAVRAGLLCDRNDCDDDGALRSWRASGGGVSGPRRAKRIL